MFTSVTGPGTLSRGSRILQQNKPLLKLEYLLNTLSMSRGVYEVGQVTNSYTDVSGTVKKRAYNNYTKLTNF